MLYVHTIYIAVGTSTKSLSPTGGQHIIRNTPTDLYQYYQKDWKRFKNHIPGEHNRANVRSAIHKKMEHKPQPNPKVIIITMTFFLQNLSPNREPNVIKVDIL